VTDWTVYPAIDLRNGQVVRLTQGHADRQTIYDRDPLAVAVRWHDAGATWLHVVNLDGAFGQTTTANQAAIARILTAGPPVQLGGGLRTLDSIQAALDLGVRRAILGTAAIENPAIVTEALNAFGPELIAVGLDVRGAKPQTHGWTRSAEIPALDLARSWAQAGLRWLVFTDSDRDGTGHGVDISAAQELAQSTGLRVIASGGVGSLDDVRQAQAAGLAGIIIGRALYEGQVDLRAALAITRHQEGQNAG
jgi:phosphoribosylformimino-5-aminoimidazole carboxamide ribotide isomerase